MKLKQIFLAFFASLALCGLISAPAVAADKSFSALDGIEVQALIATEMDAIHGEGHFLDRAIARLNARIERGFPRLAARNQALADRIIAVLTRVRDRLVAIQARRAG